MTCNIPVYQTGTLNKSLANFNMIPISSDLKKWQEFGENSPQIPAFFLDGETWNRKILYLCDFYCCVKFLFYINTLWRSLSTNTFTPLIKTKDTMPATFQNLIYLIYQVSWSFMLVFVYNKWYFDSLRRRNTTLRKLPTNNWINSQLTFTSSKSTIEALEKCVKYVQC